MYHYTLVYSRLEDNNLNIDNHISLEFILACWEKNLELIKIDDDLHEIMEFQRSHFLSACISSQMHWPAVLWEAGDSIHSFTNKESLNS